MQHVAPWIVVKLASVESRFWLVGVIALGSRLCETEGEQKVLRTDGEIKGIEENAKACSRYSLAISAGQLFSTAMQIKKAYTNTM